MSIMILVSGAVAVVLSLIVVHIIRKNMTTLIDSRKEMKSNEKVSYL